MRLFVGVELPGEVRDTLAVLVDGLRGSVPGARWVPRDNLHLTLSFLGEVFDDRMPGVNDALRAAAASTPAPIATALAGLGAFPAGRHARVLWAGLDDPEGALAAMAGSVAEKLEPLGFPRERRAWKPHLTIARFRVPADASNAASAAVGRIAFHVERVTLFRSRLGRPAPTYEGLEHFPLGR